MGFFQVIALLKKRGFFQLYLSASPGLTDNDLNYPDKWVDAKIVRMYSGTELVALMNSNCNDWQILPLHPKPHKIKQVDIPPGCIELTPENLLTLGLTFP